MTHIQQRYKDEEGVRKYGITKRVRRKSQSSMEMIIPVVF
jgi:hypothetical protein